MRIHEIDKASTFPPKISAHDLVSLVRGWHHTPQDFQDGDLFQNITSFETYELKKIPIDILTLDMFYIDDELVDEYAAQKSTAPPIIYNPVNDQIIDGNHRANWTPSHGARSNNQPPS